MVTDIPEPFTPPDADLRDFSFMPVDIVRLFGSGFHARANDAEWRAGVTLWLKSFHQTPAGSLPQDDIELCRLAELGRDVRAWKKARSMALYKWVLCSDGRLYHPIVAEKVNEAWDAKQKQRARSRAGNEARWGKKGNHADELARGEGTRARREGHPKDHDENASAILKGIQEGLQEASLKECHEDSFSDPKGQGQGKGQGQVDNLPAQRSVPPARAPAEPDGAPPGEICRPEAERPPDPGAVVGKSELDRVEDACRSALGDAQPQDLVIGPMVEIVRKFGQERVLLCLESEARRPRRKPIRTWKIWAEIVEESLAAPPPRPWSAASGQSAAPPSEQPAKRCIWSRGRWTETRPEFEPSSPEALEKIYPFERADGREDGLIELSGVAGTSYRWESQYRAHLRRWIEGGRRRHLWREDSFGADPTQPACRAPDDLLAEFGLERVPYPRDDEDAA
jgi:hypothetical protein